MTLTVASQTGLKTASTEDGVCMTALLMRVLELSATLDLQVPFGTMTLKRLRYCIMHVFGSKHAYHADKLFLIHCLSTGNLSCELLPMQIMSCSEKRDAGVERLRQKSYQRYLFPSFFIIYTI